MNTNNPNYKHGMSNTKIHSAWMSMRKRVNYKNGTGYKNYGGRGIKVCEEWNNSFERFYYDMGDSYYKHVEKYGKSNTSLDRIDNNGNYCKENCRWATREVQTRNRRGVNKYYYKGEEMFLVDIARKYGVNYGAFKARIKNLGMTIDEAIKRGGTSPKYYYFSKVANKYLVEVTRDGNRVYGGTFLTEKEAQKKVKEILKKIRQPIWKKKTYN